MDTQAGIIREDEFEPVIEVASICAKGQNMHCRYLYIFIIALFLCQGPVHAYAVDTISRPQFENPEFMQANAGHVKLSWEVTEEMLDDPGIVFELEQSEDSSFSRAEVIYKGADLASFISGLENGHYYYRLRTVGENGRDQTVRSSWSATVTVEVKHHSLELALTLAGLGSIVFLVTAGMVIQGARSNSL